eukprot:jgi/Chrzof1/13974/Cz08g19280.t1
MSTTSCMASDSVVSSCGLSKVSTTQLGSAHSCDPSPRSWGVPGARGGGGVTHTTGSPRGAATESRVDGRGTDGRGGEDYTLGEIGGKLPKFAGRISKARWGMPSSSAQQLKLLGSHKVQHVCSVANCYPQPLVAVVPTTKQ